MNTSKSIIPHERIHAGIHVIRDQKVMLDTDLAELYQVPVKALNQAVQRNLERFPEDFMFQLTREEHASLRSHSLTIEKGRGRHRKYAPYAFTEQGVGMLSSVLRSPRAVHVNIAIIRAFVQLRRMVMGNEELLQKLEKLEEKYDANFKAVFRAIRAMMRPDQNHKPTRGFGR